MKLIANWRRAWRLRSVQAALVLLVLSLLQGLQAEVLPLIQASINPKYWPWVSAAFATGIVVFRVLRQVGALDPTEAAESKREPGP